MCDTISRPEEHPIHDGVVPPRARSAGSRGSLLLTRERQGPAGTTTPEDGRGAPAEIVVNRDALPGLTKLAEVVHAEGAAVSAQLGTPVPSLRALVRPGSRRRASSARWQ